MQGKDLFLSEKFKSILSEYNAPNHIERRCHDSQAWLLPTGLITHREYCCIFCLTAEGIRFVEAFCNTMTDIINRNNVKVVGEGTQPLVFAHGFIGDQHLLKYGKLHHPQKADAEFGTFQQDSNYEWKSIVLNATN